jgi:hypothetical protein
VLLTSPNSNVPLAELGPMNENQSMELDPLEGLDTPPANELKEADPLMWRSVESEKSVEGASE